MKLVKIDPPGTICFHEAVKDLIRRLGARTFFEVGCGAGDLSKIMCDLGLSGTGVDFSPVGLEQARETLREEIAAERFDLVASDIHDLEDDRRRYDVGYSMMVMEHVEDDENFLRLIARRVKPGGHVIAAVPGRRDAWGIEDETVGHLRRYDREDLIATFQRAGFDDVDVWSIAVPMANITFGASNLLVRRSDEVNKIGQSQREQTESSGVRLIPFKTAFPSWFKLILNPVTLYPAIAAQRLFYRTGRGLTMLGFGRVP